MNFGTPSFVRLTKSAKSVSPVIPNSDGRSAYKYISITYHKELYNKVGAK